jgi:hypothetical protein
LSGSVKRIKDLQTIFDSPERYGKGLDWAGYTVHDAANVLRRYLNLLPEPIIPLDFYNRFRDPLTVQPEKFIDSDAIRVYQKLISELPPLNRQLLLYILDLLAVFASKSEINRMNAENLAAIFQPGLISHPLHEMAPQAYKLSQDVLVFLINHQDHFLLGMRGVNDDGGEPEPPVSPATPSSLRHSKTVIERPPSISSGVADDIRRNGNLRRNLSVSSRKSGSPTPVKSGGVSRRNTLPSKRTLPRPSPALRQLDGATSPQSAEFPLYATDDYAHALPSPRDQMTEDLSQPQTPRIEGLGLQSLVSHSSSGSSISVSSIQLAPFPSPPRQLESDTPIKGLGRNAPTEGVKHTVPTKEHEGALPVRKLDLGALIKEPERTKGPELGVPLKELERAAHSRDSERGITGFFQPNDSDRPPRKLRKRRVPSSTNYSAESSTASLPVAHNPNPSGNPLESISGTHNTSSSPITSTLMPTMSPTPSATSSVTSQESVHSCSDATNTSGSPEKTKKSRSRWRWSASKVDQWNPVNPAFPGAGSSNGSIAERIRRVSRSPPSGEHLVNGEESDNDYKRSRSPLSWLRKRGERKQSFEDKDKATAVAPGLSSLSSMQHPVPGLPHVQPPTPSPVGKATPILESTAEEDEPESNHRELERGQEVNVSANENPPMSQELAPVTDSTPVLQPVSSIQADSATSKSEITPKLTTHPSPDSEIENLEGSIASELTTITAPPSMEQTNDRLILSSPAPPVNPVL